MNNGVLAHRYAQAYYRVFSQSCTLDILEQLAQIASFFTSHKDALFFLGLPQLALAEKKDALVALVNKIGLPKKLIDLFLLLITHKRSILIPRVCVQLRKLILQKNDTLECVVSSAQELAQEERDTLIAFFAQRTKQNIRARYTIDKTLIAGIAMRSTMYAWEYSIRKQLHTINQMLIR